MELTSQYIILDSEKSSDYSLLKILDSVSEKVHTIYFLRSDNIYYYHDPDNCMLSVESINKRFTNLQDLLNYIKGEKAGLNVRKYSSKVDNTFNLGRKKVPVKFILNRKDLELQSKTETKTEISSEIPKERSCFLRKCLPASINTFLGTSPTNSEPVTRMPLAMALSQVLSNTSCKGEILILVRL